jgi:small subunit ribosomal protein S17
MFRRKKKEPKETTRPEVLGVEADAPPSQSPGDTAPEAATSGGTRAPATEALAAAAPEAAAQEPDGAAGRRSHRAQKVGIVSADKMQKTVVVRVDRLVLHQKYRRYIRRTSKFMAHDELGATVGDRVRIVETRPLSAHKRWRVVEIVQKAAK